MSKTSENTSGLPESRLGLSFKILHWSLSKMPSLHLIYGISRIKALRATCCAISYSPAPVQPPLILCYRLQPLIRKFISTELRKKKETLVYTSRSTKLIYYSWYSFNWPVRDPSIGMEQCCRSKKLLGIPPVRRASSAATST